MIRLAGRRRPFARGCLHACAAWPRTSASRRRVNGSQGRARHAAEGSARRRCHEDYGMMQFRDPRFIDGRTSTHERCTHHSRAQGQGRSSRAARSSRSSTRMASRWSTPGPSIAPTSPSSCRWSTAAPHMPAADPAARRHAAYQPAPADPDADRGHFRRHPRHADRRLRPLSLRACSAARISRQLHRQSARRRWRSSASTPPEMPSPLNLFMNIPWMLDGTLAFAAPPQARAGRLCGAARRDGSASRCPPVRRTSCRSTARPKPVEAHFHRWLEHASRPYITAHDVRTMTA